MASLTKEINGKEYKFKLSIRFVKELDKLVTVKQDGIPFGVGSAIKLAQLKNANDITALLDILKVANDTESPKLSVTELSNWLDDELTLEDLDFLIAEVIEALETSNATASKMKALAAEAKK